MRNLYLRIFVTFWTAMVLVLTFTVVTTLWLAEQRDQRERVRLDDFARQASNVLSSDGIPGVRDWLMRQADTVEPDRLFVLDRHGNDLLGRHVPEFLQAAIGHRPFPDMPREERDVRILSQLVTPTDEVYAVALLRAPRPFGIFNSTETPIVMAVTTLMVSTIVCFLLARYLSDPIRHLRAATRSIAHGDLGVRVSSMMGRRRDELAMLAVDFDVMAERLRNLLESQRQLLRDVSHELRSPLARLQIALGLARRPNADLEQEFDRIEQETQRLDELIGEILSLSRLEDPSRELVIESVSIEELLETLAENARLEAEPHWVRVDLKVPATLAVEGDRELLFRAVENVIRNALRFSPNGSSLDIHAEQQGQQAVIQVTDHGPGVPPELLERIFEPFFRVGKARERETGGSGIGLAITSRVVALHGGTVRARNCEHGGLEVTIALPLHRTPARQTPSIKSSASPLLTAPVGSA